MRLIFAIAGSCLVLAGCYQEPEVRVTAQPVEEILETSVGAAYAVQEALAALEGTSPGIAPCVRVADGCTNAGCDIDVELDVGPDCPIPMSPDGTGVLVVTGVWTDDDTAVIGAAYGDLRVADELWFVQEIGTMVVTRTSGDELIIAYAQQDVAIRSGVEASSARLKQHAWVVNVASDGTLTVSGGVQEANAGVESAGVKQVALAAAEMQPTCPRNPTNGIATMQFAHADGADAATSTTTLSFHPECDGRADVIASVGVGAGPIPLPGSSLPLDLTD